MEPQIQYARSSDGVNIAFWATGEGTPLLMTPSIPLGHAQLDWQLPDLRAWYENLGRDRTLISYNGRGSGLSDRDPADYSLEAHILDIEAVVDAVGSETFDLFGIFHSGLVAMAYAAKHPERVSRLIVLGAYLRGAEYARAPRVQASRALLAMDWESYLEALALFTLGWSDEEAARQVVGWMRESVTQEGMIRAIREFDRFDATEIAPLVRSSTLLVHLRQMAWPPLDAVRSLAAAIPGARLAIVEGERVLPWANESSTKILEVVNDFLAEPVLRPAPDLARPSGAPLLDSLTARETEVLRLVASGSSNKEIGAELSLSVHTVERHLANIYAKIGARGRADATSFAHRSGLV